MARLPRFMIPGQPQHVIQRGNNRQDIFLEEHDYQFYLDKLKEASEKHGCDIHAYVLMSNHVHLVVTPHQGDSIGKMMQMLGRYYVQYFNKLNDRTGTLWEGRYKSTLIDTERYLLTCMHYIELNPVRARNMVSHPSQYPWSSYRYHALGQRDALVSPHREYRRLGATVADRQAAYRRLFQTRIAETTLETIRDATSGQWALGNDRCMRKMETRLERSVRSSGHGGDRKSETYRKVVKYQVA